MTINGGNLTGANPTVTVTPVINITGGVVSVASDSALGNSANQIWLNANATTGVGLRATGTFGTSRAIVLQQGSNAIEVSSGNTLTLNGAFTWGAAANALYKNDIGTLVLTQAETGWNGIMTVNQGSLQITNAGALGTTAGNTVVAERGAELALNLSGTNTLADQIQLNTVGDGAALSGINAAGMIHNMAGTNTLSGPIWINGVETGDSNSRSVVVAGVDAGSSLNIAGGVQYNFASGGTSRSIFLPGQFQFESLLSRQLCESRSWHLELYHECFSTDALGYHLQSF